MGGRVHHSVEFQVLTTLGILEGIYFQRVGGLVAGGEEGEGHHQFSQPLSQNHFLSKIILSCLTFMPSIKLSETQIFINNICRYVCIYRVFMVTNSII